jgi:CubicO group peptidase (beta-lactamase class C family)
MYLFKRRLICLMHSIIIVLNLATVLTGQVRHDDPLFKAIAAKDSLLFDIGFNACDMSGFDFAVSNNFEFYHDKSGILKGKETFIQAFKNNLCAPDAKFKARRQLLKGTMEVFPLYNGGVLYGAIQNGDHRFFEKNMATGVEVMTSEAKITHLWLLEQNEWKLVRSLSYDHQTPLLNKIDGLLTQFASRKLFNGVALVAKNGEIILEKGYGYRDVDQKILHDSNSIFVIYSITKSITSTLMIKLSELGYLSLDDNLGNYFPTWIDGRKVTIRQVLSHTGGLANYTNDAPLPKYDEANMIAYLNSKNLEFEPGTKFNYCNTGFYLLGCIVQKATRMTYEQAMKKYIFAPVGMVHSGFDFKNLQSQYKSKAYQKISADQAIEAEVYDSTRAYAAGAMYSTVGDMYRFHNAMANNTIIKEYYKIEAYTPVIGNYGLGWNTMILDDYKVIGHSGGAVGFRSNMSSIESEGIYVVLLSNTEVDLNTQSTKLLYTLLNKTQKNHIEMPIEKSLLASFTGVYALGNESQFYCVANKGKLMVKPPDGTMLETIYIGRDSFYEPLADVEFTFLRNTSGAVTSFRFIRKDGSTITLDKTQEAWGLVGSAVPNGWNGPDIVLKQKPDKSWVAKGVSLGEGEIKLRVNNAWSINLGKGLSEETLTYNGDNIKVSRGKYDITLYIEGQDFPRLNLTKNQ